MAKLLNVRSPSAGGIAGSLFPMSSQTAQETMPTISPGDEVIVMSQQTPSLQRAPVAGVSIALTVFPNSSGNVQSDSSSLKPDQAPSHPVPSMSWVARAHRFKYWLTKPRVNLSIGILSLIPAVIFGDGAWVQSNRSEERRVGKECSS